MKDADRMRLPRRWLIAVCVSMLSIPLSGQDSDPSLARAPGVQASQLLSRTIKDDWPSYNGDYTGRRFSSLTQITPQNVGHLQAQWVFHSRNAGILEVTPVVVNGVMYVTASNDAYALNAQTGEILWHYSRPISSGLIDDASGHISRGVALLGTRLYMETDNAHLLCLDARSGHLIWDVAYADWNRNYGATSAPLVVKDKVIVGTSGGDDGVRGFIAAYDAQTGKLAWRLWTIPGPGEFGAESWPDKLYLHGGGTTWMPGTYDPELNTIYWGTSNPAPDFEGSLRPGDNLYTDCLLALDPDTGKLKWYFQFTPHDLFDYDAVETPVLVDATFRGQPRKLIVEANRNGFLYVLDRTNGAFLSATRFAEKLNWASGIDQKGRPVRTGIKPTEAGARICPGFSGATNWYAPAFYPDAGMIYFLALENCHLYTLKAKDFKPGQTYYSTGVRQSENDHGQKVLLAYALESDKPAWRYVQAGDGRSAGGVMATAGGLVFFGDDAQSFEAVDARTGKSLWHFNTGQHISASPMTYAVNSKQFVAIAAGSDIFTFSLP